MGLSLIRTGLVKNFIWDSASFHFNGGSRFKAQPQMERPLNDSPRYREVLKFYWALIQSSLRRSENSYLESADGTRS